MNEDERTTEEFEEEYELGEKCPQCGSKDTIRIGTIAGGELAQFKCNKCGHYWEEFN